MRRIFIPLTLVAFLASAEDAWWGTYVHNWVPDPGELTIKDSVLREHPDRGQFFPKNDPLLLPVVRAALAEPLKVPLQSEINAGRALRAPHYGGLAAYVGKWPAAAKYEPKSPGDHESLVPEARAALSILYGAATVATAEVEVAFAQLSDEERLALRTTLPTWLTRTTAEDKQRALAGEEDVEGRKAMLRCAALMGRVDRTRLRVAASTVMAGIHAALPGLRKQKQFKPGNFRIETPLGDVILRSSSNSGGTNDALIVIDFGGDDEFKTPDKLEYRPVRIHIDLGGDDIYISEASHAWAGALCGVSVLVDVAGDDDYRGADWSLGCGLAGHGVLWDMEGNDRYMGALATQAVGIFGTGILRDDAGHDEYHCGLFAQGFGSTAGVGALIDGSGDDVYIAGRDEEDMWRRVATWVTFAQGSAYSHRFGHIWIDEKKQRRWKMTGQLAGGVGLLFDGSGNDRYMADVFGQGSAYWYSLGVLVDLKGDDAYRATWYGQGVGTHAAVGCVVDAGGNDRYMSRQTSQGCGHDFSAGLLVDRAGNDSYRAVQLSQGAGHAASGIGLLLDEGGDDSYRCWAEAWGYARPLKSKPELSPYGFFIDMGGKNTYTGRFAAQRTKGAWRQGERGFGSDEGEG